METNVIEVSEHNFKVRSDLRCLEATMASEDTKMTVLGNLYMETVVIKVAEFKSEVTFDH